MTFCFFCLVSILTQCVYRPRASKRPTLVRPAAAGMFSKQWRVYQKGKKMSSNRDKQRGLDVSRSIAYYVARNMAITEENDHAKDLVDTFHVGPKCHRTRDAISRKSAGAQALRKRGAGCDWHILYESAVGNPAPRSGVQEPSGQLRRARLHCDDAGSHPGLAPTHRALNSARQRGGSRDTLN